MVTFMLSPLVALQIEQLLSLKITTVAVVCLGFLPPPGTRRHHHPVATGSCDSHLVMIRYMTVKLFLVNKLLVTFLTFILGPARPYLAVLGLTGPYSALLSLIQPYLALLGLT